MSLSRFGLDSDVYVFEDVSGGITCAHMDIDNFNGTIREALKHLIRHREDGDEIPDRVLEELSLMAALADPPRLNILRDMYRALSHPEPPETEL